MPHLPAKRQGDKSDYTRFTYQGSGGVEILWSERMRLNAAAQ